MGRKKNVENSSNLPIEPEAVSAIETVDVFQPDTEIESRLHSSETKDAEKTDINEKKPEKPETYATDAEIPDDSIDLNSTAEEKTEETAESRSDSMEDEAERIVTLQKEIQSLKTRLEEERGKYMSELNRLNLYNLIRDSAQAGGYIDPSDAVLILKEKFKIDGDDIYLEDRKIEKPSIRRTIDKIVSDLSSSKPHLVRMNLRGGSNASPSEVSLHKSRNPMDFSSRSARRSYEQELRRRGLPVINPVD